MGKVRITRFGSHWGLELDILQGADVEKMFSKYHEWLGVFGQLNATGMFNNSFTDRMGISITPGQLIRLIITDLCSRLICILLSNGHEGVSEW